jgi:Flp pilus assembly protein TadB
VTLAFASLAVAFALSAVAPDRLWRMAGHAARAADPREPSRRRERRAAMPALVEAIAAALAGGLSLPQAFAEVAPSLPADLATPTRRVAAALALGEPLESALIAYRGTLPNEDLAPFATVLGAFARSGGRVARGLTRVAGLLRGRLGLEDEQRALTAQGRVSAAVLVLLAPLGAVLFAVVMPSYLPTLTGPGRWLLVAAVGLEILAALWLGRLLRIASPPPGLASLLDAVVVGLGSAMTFEQALRSLVDRAPRLATIPAARTLLADLALGQGAPRAFARFASSGPDQARIAALVVSSLRSGAPFADLLVLHADALREADRRRAEAAARRLPILMLFPLTFCVLPALLIVFLGPPLLSLGS